MHVKNFDPYDFTTEVIEDTPIYYKNLPWAPCIHMWVVFNTGALEDPVGKEGLSHFLEHMIFDGSPKLTDKKAIKEWSKINALNSWNAWTSFDNTAYTWKCLPESFGETLIGIKDMIFNSYLREIDVEHERKVIMQEAWGRFLNDKFLKYSKELSQNIFKGHNHSRTSSPLGWPETIGNIQRDDLVRWHKKKYGKGNMFVVLVGAVQIEHLNLLTKFMKDIPDAEAKEAVSEKIEKLEIQHITKTADEIGEVKEQVEISILRTSLPLDKSEDEIVSLFRRTLQDLLHERLRIEHSLCYSVHIAQYTTNSFFLMGLNVKTEEKNIDLVIQEFWKIMDEIIEGKYREKFETIKKLSLDQTKSKERSSNDIGELSLREISRNNGIVVTLEKQLASIEKVTYDEMVEFAKKIFHPDHTFTEVILPSKK